MTTIYNIFARNMFTSNFRQKTHIGDNGFTLQSPCLVFGHFIGLMIIAKNVIRSSQSCDASAYDHHDVRQKFQTSLRS